jgi:hypothetical protein
VAAPGKVNFALLGKNFLMPLLCAPLLAVVAGGLLYLLLRAARLALRVEKEMCICVGGEPRTLAIERPAGLLSAEVLPEVSITTGTLTECRQPYGGRLLGVSVGGVVDSVHFLSAGAVGFARGLNDTPKIAALLLVASALDIGWGIAAVAAAMALGGWLTPRRRDDGAQTLRHEPRPGLRGESRHGCAREHGNLERPAREHHACERRCHSWPGHRDAAGALEIRRPGAALMGCHAAVCRADRRIRGVGRRC